MTKPILKHIEEHYGGSCAAMAKALGIHRQSVNQWVRNGARVTADGYIIGKKAYRDTIGLDKGHED